MATPRDEEREVMTEKWNETGDVEAINWLVKDACERGDDE